MSPFDAALPSTEDLFSVIEAIHDNVAIVDHNGVMRWVSSCFERNYGISRDRVIGRTTYELEAEKVFSPSVAALVLKTRRVVTLTEATRSGQYNIVTGVPIYDDDGDVSFVVSYSVDMRYSRRLHEEYQKISALVSPNAPQTSGGLPFSGTMRAIAATIEKLAKVNTTVLITGESGVGKNVVARLVHHLSDRTNGPLVEINCAGIPAPLLESELFGYEAGAFTGASHKGKEGRIALADKGTLFLDEIGELPLRLQSKLLQVIQEKQIVKLGGVKPVSIDFRLVAATNQDLEALVEKKRFRSDLFFRLNVLPLWIPPLRERREEIVPLCLSILGEMNAKYGTLVEKADPQQVHQPYIVSETTFDKGVARGWALRTPRYKYVLYDKGLYREQLYDMLNDRGEMRNLAIEKKYRQILLQHRAYLNEWMKLHHVVQIRPEVHLIPDM